LHGAHPRRPRRVGPPRHGQGDLERARPARSDAGGGDLHDRSRQAGFGADRRRAGWHGRGRGARRGRDRRHRNGGQKMSPKVSQEMSGRPALAASASASASAARRAQGGFTLIEIMAAFGILAFVTSIMWGSFTQTATYKRVIEPAQDRAHTLRNAM